MTGLRQRLRCNKRQVPRVLRWRASTRAGLNKQTSQTCKTVISASTLPKIPVPDVPTVSPRSPSSRPIDFIRTTLNGESFSVNYKSRGSTQFPNYPRLFALALSGSYILSCDSHPSDRKDRSPGDQKKKKSIGRRRSAIGA